MYTNAERKKIDILFLNAEKLSIFVTPKLQVAELLDLAASHLGLRDRRGLWLRLADGEASDSPAAWLSTATGARVLDNDDIRKRGSQLELRVKHLPPPGRHRDSDDPVWRRQLMLECLLRQRRRQRPAASPRCDRCRREAEDDEAALAAIAMQAELGDLETVGVSRALDFIRQQCLFPSSDQCDSGSNAFQEFAAPNLLESRAILAYGQLRGAPPEAATCAYLDLAAVRLPSYGCNPLPAVFASADSSSSTGGQRQTLCLNDRGIGIHWEEDGAPVEACELRYPWRSVENLYCKDKRFLVDLVPPSEQSLIEDADRALLAALREPTTVLSVSRQAASSASSPAVAASSASNTVCWRTDSPAAARAIFEFAVSQHKFTLDFVDSSGLTAHLSASAYSGDSGCCSCRSSGSSLVRRTSFDRISTSSAEAAPVRALQQRKPAQLPTPPPFSGSDRCGCSSEPAGSPTTPAAAAADPGISEPASATVFSHPAITQLAAAAAATSSHQQLSPSPAPSVTLSCSLFHSSQSVNRLPLHHGSSGSLNSSHSASTDIAAAAAAAAVLRRCHRQFPGHHQPLGQQHCSGSVADLRALAGNSPVLTGGRISDDLDDRQRGQIERQRRECRAALVKRYWELRGLLTDLRAQRSTKEAELAKLVAEEKELSSSTDRCQPTQFLVAVGANGSGGTDHCDGVGGEGDSLTPHNGMDEDLARELAALQLETSVQKAKVDATTRLLREAKETGGIFTKRQLKKHRVVECQRAQEQLHQLNRRIQKLRAEAVTRNITCPDFRLGASLGSLATAGSFEQIYPGSRQQQQPRFHTPSPQLQTLHQHRHQQSQPADLYSLSSDISRDSSSQSLSAGLACSGSLRRNQPAASTSDAVDESADASSVLLRRGGSLAAKSGALGRRSNSLGDLLDGGGGGGGFGGLQRSNFRQLPPPPVNTSFPAEPSLLVREDSPTGAANGAAAVFDTYMLGSNDGSSDHSGSAEFLSSPLMPPQPRQRRYLKKTGSASRGIRPPGCHFQEPLPPLPQTPQPQTALSSEEEQRRLWRRGILASDGDGVCADDPGVGDDNCFEEASEKSTYL